MNTEELDKTYHHEYGFPVEIPEFPKEVPGDGLPGTLNDMLFYARNLTDIVESGEDFEGCIFLGVEKRSGICRFESRKMVARDAIKVWHRVHGLALNQGNLHTVKLAVDKIVSLIG